jgi:hypothetical protein
MMMDDDDMNQKINQHFKNNINTGIEMSPDEWVSIISA